MLKKVEVVSDLNGNVLCTIPVSDYSSTDRYFIRNIDGVTPEKLDVSVQSYANIDGGFVTGTRRNSRHIVLDIQLLPTRSLSASDIRKELYRRLEIGNTIWLRFTSDRHETFRIKGIVESNESNLFSSDTRMTVSIVCPYPHFLGLARTKLDGVTNQPLNVFDRSNAPTPFRLIITVSQPCSRMRVWVGDKEGLILDTSSLSAGDKVYICTEETARFVSVSKAGGSYSRSLDLIVSGDLMQTFGDVNTANIDVRTTPVVSNNFELYFFPRWAGL